MQGWDASWPVGSSWARDQTCVFCIGRQVLYHWATKEALRLVLLGLEGENLKDCGCGKQCLLQWWLVLEDGGYAAVVAAEGIPSLDQVRLRMRFKTRQSMSQVGSRWRVFLVLGPDWGWAELGKIFCLLLFTFYSPLKPTEMARRICWRKITS